MNKTRILILLSLILLTTTVFSQKRLVSRASAYKDAGELKKAFADIEEAVNPANEKSEKTLPWPKTWEVRGEIMVEIDKKGVKDLVDEPLFEALESFKKVAELDEKGRYKQALVMNLTLLQTSISNQAVSAFKAENYERAVRSFEKHLEISDLDVIKEASEGEAVDSAIIFNAGMAAYRGELWDDAIKYLTKSARIGYNGEISYKWVYDAYIAKGDSVAGFEVLQEGFNKHSDNEALIVDLINYFMSKGEQEDAIVYIDQAIKNNPNNVSFYPAKGTILEKLGRVEEAIDVYKEAIRIDDNQYTPYFNLGVIYYNRGVNELNEATQLPPNATEEYNQKMEKGKENLKEALPYMERAYELNDKDMGVLESLRLIYYRLQMNEKYKKIDEKIKNISPE